MNFKKTSNDSINGSIIMTIIQQANISRPAWLQTWPQELWKIIKTLLEQVEYEKNHRTDMTFWSFHLFPMIFRCYSNEITSYITWYPILSDPTTGFRPRLRTASVSPQKHVGKWQYLHIMKTWWKGSESSETVYAFFIVFREFPRGIQSYFKHKTFFQSKTLSL